jgi:hypothetical protein
MDRVDGSLAHHEIQSKKISYILNHYIYIFGIQRGKETPPKSSSTICTTLGGGFA